MDNDTREQKLEEENKNLRENLRRSDYDRGYSRGFNAGGGCLIPVCLMAMGVIGIAWVLI